MNICLIALLVVRCPVAAHGDVGTQSICGTDDGRMPSSDPRQGKIIMNDKICTAWMISSSVFVTAGHCKAPNASSRMKFSFEDKWATVAPENQYAIELSTYKLEFDENNDLDWAAGRLLPNAVTGTYPTEPKGGWYSIDSSAPSEGANVRITGYGADTIGQFQCDLCQQTQTGSLSGSNRKNIYHRVDTMVSTA